jgi:hypothetical protein
MTRLRHLAIGSGALPPAVPGGVLYLFSGRRGAGADKHL